MYLHASMHTCTHDCGSKRLKLGVSLDYSLPYSRRQQILIEPRAHQPDQLHWAAHSENPDSARILSRPPCLHSIYPDAGDLSTHAQEGLYQLSHFLGPKVIFLNVKYIHQTQDFLCNKMFPDNKVVFPTVPICPGQLYCACPSIQSPEIASVQHPL